MPKASVVIVTYNRSHLVGGAITSVLNQTFQDYEIIVVDDASTDNTGEIVRAFDDKRITYIRHETNKKVASARNTGVQNAKGEYIAFLDDDDEWLPQKLKKQVDLLNSSPPLVGAVYTGFRKIDRTTGKTLFQAVPVKRGNIFQDLFIENWVGTASTVLIRKECFQKVGMFDEKMFFGEDWDMWIRIAREFHIDYISEPLVKYYVHDTKLSTNYGIIIKGREAYLKKYAAFLALDRKNHSGWYFNLGILYCFNGNVNNGRKAFLNAIKIHPFYIRYYFAVILSFLGPGWFRKTIELKENTVSSFKHSFYNLSCN